MLSLDLATLQTHYASGSLQPTDLAALILDRIADCAAENIWITRVEDAMLMARAAELTALSAEMRAQLPLFGIPFAVKDNIDVAGLPTTAACPDFAYVPSVDAPVVAQLLAAGAMLVGKTNLDQFATGLVGTRSPYGACTNPLHPDYITGGSSAGSAAAVSAGLVSFALGTDTAGSGRVPAAFTNIVGLKPTRGLLSTRAVVAACRSLDCVSIFALTCADAERLLAIASSFDPNDPFARQPRPDQGQRRLIAGSFRMGIPDAESLAFFGNEAYAAAWDAALAQLSALGGSAESVPFAPFLETANLLYDGPWVAERFAAVGDFILNAPDAVLPTTRDIVLGGQAISAEDTFNAYYRLRALRQQLAPLWDTLDVLVVPTAGTIFTQGQVAEEPVLLNTQLGRYTNFVNLLDLAALAVPMGFTPAGLPFGVTLLAPAFEDRALLDLGRRVQAATALPLGATGLPLPISAEGESAPADDDFTDEYAPVAVFGLHLAGQPLNHQLTDLGGRLTYVGTTAPEYRFFALQGGGPEKPGAVLVTDGSGAAIELEVWEVPLANLGRFVRQIPPPLGYGTVKLASGEQVQGFICEGYGTATAQDITDYGGWRAYLAAQSKGPSTC